MRGQAQRQFLQALQGVFRTGVGLSMVVACGCASRGALAPDVRLIEQTPPYLYSDADWAEVLQQFSHHGLVDYAGLADHPGVLRRYYALLSKTGPSSTPDQFASRQQTVAYWVNAYNAMVILAVLKNYP